MPNNSCLNQWGKNFLSPIVVPCAGGGAGAGVYVQATLGGTKNTMTMASAAPSATLGCIAGCGAWAVITGLYTALTYDNKPPVNSAYVPMNDVPTMSG